MRYISLLTLALLAGCTGLKTYQAPDQTYRAPGHDQATAITGRIDQSQGLTPSATLRVQFDGAEVLRGPINTDGNGDINGGTWEGKPVSASCHGINKRRHITVNCLVFVGTDRTVTLTFP